MDINTIESVDLKSLCETFSAKLNDLYVGIELDTKDKSYVISFKKPNSEKVGTFKLDIDWFGLMNNTDLQVSELFTNKVEVANKVRKYITSYKDLKSNKDASENNEFEKLNWKISFILSYYIIEDFVTKKLIEEVSKTGK